MSIGWSDKSTIYGNIGEEVFNQIKKRQEIFNESNRSNDQLLFLNSNNSWVKLTSGVTVDGSSKLAKEHILFAGTDGNNRQGIFNDSPAYSFSEQYGYRPMPGLLNVNIKTDGSSFGAVKKASVSFQVNSLEDLNIIEKLYMVPNFSMLLEWGHSLILSNDGKLTGDVRTYTNFIENVPKTDVDKGIHASEAILKALQVLRSEQSFNYDALFGKVSNFIWSFNAEGFYDCSIDITGYGEVAESFSGLFNPNPTEKDKEVLGESTSLFRSALDAADSIITTINTSDLLSNLNNVYNLSKREEIDFILRNIGDILLTPLSNISEDKTPYFKYIPLGGLLNAINKNFTLKDESVPPVKYYCGAYNTEVKQIPEPINQTPFVTFDNHIPHNLSICMLPKPQLYKKAGLYYVYSGLKATNEIIKGEHNDILNILLEVNYVKSVYDELLEKGENEEINIYDLVLKILNGIQKSCGQINSFEIAEQDQIKYIVDRNIVPGKEDIKKEINLYGKESTAVNVTLESQIPSSLSSLIAIGASAGGTDLNENIFNFQNYYLGLKDRIYPTKTVSKSPVLDEAAELGKLQLNVNALSRYINTINTQKKVPDTTYSDIVTSHQIVTNLFLKDTIIKADTNAPSVIPVTLSFDILGVSGLKITDIFTLKPGLLPERYDGRVGFVITGIDNKIESDKWYTTVSAQMIIVEKYTETEPIEIDIEGITLSTSAAIREAARDNHINQPGFPHATEVRKNLNTFVTEKPEQLTSSGFDIRPETADFAIELMKFISKELKSSGGMGGNAYPNLRLRWTAGNDAFHLSNGTVNHSSGKALDLAFNPPKQYKPREYKFIKRVIKKYIKGKPGINFEDEHPAPDGKPSAHATGPHFHFTIMPGAYIPVNYKPVDPLFSGRRINI